MRIRSNLTSRNLYSDSRSRDGSPPGGKRPFGRSPGRFSRTPQRASAGRRIFRLGLMLVLVLLLMQRAADPELYRRIFGALGAPLEGPVARDAAALKRDAAVLERDAAAELPPERTGQAAATGPAAPLTATVDALDDEQLDRLSALLAARRRGPGAEETAAPGAAVTVPSSLLQSLMEAAEASGEVDPAALAAALESVPGRGANAAGGAEHDEILRRLQAALDARYWKTVSDASVWQPGDADAFYRLLEMQTLAAGKLGAEQPTRVGYAALAAQPQVYRGQPVSLAGHAVRVEPHPAAKNPFGVERYWRVWVRPEDGSERPMMVYTAELPSPLEELGPDETRVDGPRIVAEGTFLKRQLYPSQRGSELAPVIVGKIAEVEVPASGWGGGMLPGLANAAGDGGAAGDEGAAGGEVDEGRDRGEPPGWWYPGLIAAIVVPILATLLAGWSASRAARRRRELRARSLPDTPFTP